MSLTLEQNLSNCCKTIFRNLVGANMPNQYDVTKTLGTIAALESPVNKAFIPAGLEDSIKQLWGRGSINDTQNTTGCTVKVWVEKLECDEGSGGIKVLCNNNNNIAPVDNRVQMNVKVGLGQGEEGRITPADWNCMCRGEYSDVFNADITMKARRILQRVNKDCLDIIYDQMGNYSDNVASTTAPKVLNLFNSSQNQFHVQPIGWNPALIEYQKMQTLGGMIALGGQMAHSYVNALRLTSAPNGVGYKLPNGIEMFLDNYVDSKATAPLPNWLLTWAPGAFGMLRYMHNANPSQTKILGPNTKHSVVEIYGQLFDLSITVDDKCEIIRYVLNYAYDMYYLPDELFSDCLNTNQRQAYQIGCDPITCGTLV